MSIRIRSLAFLVAAACAGGCVSHSIHSGGKGHYPPRNEVPIAGNFATSTQAKLQAAEHWRRAANDSAQALAKSLRASADCKPAGSCTLVHVQRACNSTGCAPQACETTFMRVFHNDFVTALVAQGFRVAAVPTPNALTVEVDVQAVAFAPNRPQYRYAGQAVELAPGLWARSDNVALVAPDGTMAPHTMAFDTNWYRTEFAAGRTPRNELVITTSAMSASQVYLGRDTRVYYTSDPDARHYFCGEQQARARTWSIPVRGDCSPGRCSDVRDGRPR